MRLLICTQAVDQDDPTLGFFHEWIAAFSRHCERVIVVCLFAGRHALPENVTVLSLGKEAREKNARGIFLARLRFLSRFFYYIWHYRHGYDTVFVHMNQLYVLLGGLLWRLFGKRVCLWYAHGAVSLSLSLAEKLAHTIVTSTPEGFRVASDKVRVVGQGIDTAQFAGCAREFDSRRIRLVYVGRISPVKHCEVLIDAAGLLRARGEEVFATLVGDTHAPGTGEYVVSLQDRVRTLGITAHVTFTGGVSHERVVQYLCDADMFVNPSETGSLDKAGVEALAAGVPVITCNEAFAGVLGAYRARLMFPKGDAQVLAERILAFHRAPDRQTVIETLTTEVREKHSLNTLIPRILSEVATEP